MTSTQYAQKLTVNSTNDNLMKEVEEGTLTRGQLVRNAHHICQFLMNTHAMARMLGEDEKVELLNYVSPRRTLIQARFIMLRLRMGLALICEMFAQTAARSLFSVWMQWNVDCIRLVSRRHPTWRSLLKH